MSITILVNALAADTTHTLKPNVFTNSDSIGLKNSKIDDKSVVLLTGGEKLTLCYILLTR